MPDTSTEFSLAERAILRNQRLIMLALLASGKSSKATDDLRIRVQEMDRHWKFITSNPLVPYDPDHKDIFGEESA